jgi:hypothetical protein
MQNSVAVSRTAAYTQLLHGTFCVCTRKYPDAACMQPRHVHIKLPDISLDTVWNVVLLCACITVDRLTNRNTMCLHKITFTVTQLLRVLRCKLKISKSDHCLRNISLLLCLSFLIEQISSQLKICYGISFLKIFEFWSTQKVFIKPCEEQRIVYKRHMYIYNHNPLNYLNNEKYIGESSEENQ